MLIIGFLLASSSNLFKPDCRVLWTLQQLCEKANYALLVNADIESLTDNLRTSDLSQSKQSKA